MLYFVACFFVGLWAFIAVMHAKAIFANLTVFWKIVVAPLAVIGLVLDWLFFNWLLGSLMFLELPRELLLTSRVKRHYRTSDGWRRDLATWWRRQLNLIDPGHIK